MMVTRDDIVAEALRWIGTPHVWAQSVRGRGCDCKGLIFGIARELGLPEADIPEARDQNYRRAAPRALLAGLRASLRPTAPPGRPGDVLALLLRRESEPRHLAIKVNDREMVHCYGGAVDRVVKVPIGKSRPIHSIWTWPSLGGN